MERERQRLEKLEKERLRRMRGGAGDSEEEEDEGEEDEEGGDGRADRKRRRSEASGEGLPRGQGVGACGRDGGATRCCYGLGVLHGADGVAGGPAVALSVVAWELKRMGGHCAGSVGNVRVGF